MDFSAKIEQVKPSATLDITSKAKDMISKGIDVVVLAAGEPDFDTPQVIKKAACRAIEDGFTRYTPASGTKGLKEYICQKLKIDNNLEYDPSQIVVSNGAKHSLYNVLQVICNPGDEVMIVPPYWLSYPEMVKLADGKPVVLEVSEKDNFKVTPEHILEAYTNKTKAIILNSPSNPAGIVYSKEEFERICEVCVEKEIFIISDEIYEKIIYDGKKHFSPAGLSEKVKAITVTVNGLSKSHAMTGWRIGYLAAQNKDIVSMVSSLQSHSTSNPCSISQKAAECALSTDLSGEIKKNQQEYQKRRDVLFDLLSKNEKIRLIKPEGAFYMFCDISEYGMDSLSFSKKLLEEKNVAVIPGGPFGDDRFIRISFATDLKTIEEGVKRLNEWVETL